MFLVFITGFNISVDGISLYVDEFFLCQIVFGFGNAIGLGWPLDINIIYTQKGGQVLTFYWMEPASVGERSHNFQTDKILHHFFLIYLFVFANCCSQLKIAPSVVSACAVSLPTAIIFFCKRRLYSYLYLNEYKCIFSLQLQMIQVGVCTLDARAIAQKRIS